ncbi:MAG: PilZ domain-containing protein [Candidatus Omnitrophota bacterium]|nr:PilZ domain-containing protein [Candidatus Omnitrophota bacterium]MBU1894558.1 PilZ domain-containing protein [Candidatus Omnitrophota bacterium]
MNLKWPERRRFIRVDVPLKVTFKNGNYLEKGVTINISPVGVKFESAKEIKADDEFEIALYLPSIDNPIHIKAKIVWQKKTSLEDKAPYEVGAEIISIKETDKNIFLKYLCDLFYNSTYELKV